jgi:AbrB family looped-hinge helix DNA binding protein
MEPKMAVVKVRQNYQITIPQSVRKNLKIDVGDYVQLEDHGGEIIIKPVRVIPADEAYFYTKEWQKGETQADKDIAKGDVVGPFEKAEDALKALKKAKI